MTQTRAIGKAYRNVIGWVMKTAGHEVTPAEEMARGGDVTSTPVVNIEVAPQTEDKPAEGRDIGLDRRFAYFRYRLRATA
jgi:hypothetical protein